MFLSDIRCWKTLRNSPTWLLATHSTVTSPPGDGGRLRCLITFSSSCCQVVSASGASEVVRLSHLHNNKSTQSLKGFTERSQQGALSAWDSGKHVRFLDSRADVPDDYGCRISRAATGQHVVLFTDDGTWRTYDILNTLRTLLQLAACLIWHQ